MKCKNQKTSDIESGIGEIFVCLPDPGFVLLGNSNKKKININNFVMILKLNEKNF